MPRLLLTTGWSGRELQNVAIELLRLGQPASAMVADGRLQLGLKLSSLWKDCHRPYSPLEMVSLCELNWK